MLPPGWHFPLWRGSTRSSGCRSSRCSPGRSRSSSPRMARDSVRARARPRGRRATTSRTPCASSTNGGEKGRQLAMLTAGKYRINPALFDIVTADACAALRPRARAAPRVPRAAPIASASSRRSTAGRFRPAISPGPSVPGHDSFQRGAGVHRRGRLPRSAGGRAAVGRVEPEPVVRRASSWSRSPRFRSATSAWSSATSAASTSTSPVTASRTATSSSGAARACGSSRCCPASIRSTRAR